MSARATGESVEKIEIAASSSGVSMPICPRLPGARNAGALCGGVRCSVKPPTPPSVGSAIRRPAQRRRKAFRSKKRPPGGRPSRIGNALLAASGSDGLRPRTAIAGKSEAQEAEHHHRPSRWLGNRARKPFDFGEKFVADNLVREGGRMGIVVIEVGIWCRAARADWLKRNIRKRRSYSLGHILPDCRG